MILYGLRIVTVEHKKILRYLLNGGKNNFESSVMLTF